MAISVPLALGGSVLGYGLAAIGLALIVGSFKPTPEGPQALDDRGRSARASTSSGTTAVLRPLAIMVAASNLANSAVVAVFVLFAVAPGPMGLDEVGYGLLITAMAVGGIARLASSRSGSSGASDAPTCSSSWSSSPAW